MQRLLKEEEALRRSVASWMNKLERKGLPKFEFDDQLTYFENVRAFKEFLQDKERERPKRS